MKILKRGRKQGFTLVEILLVVGFIASAGIGIYTVYTKVQMSNSALTEGRNLDTLRAGIKGLFGGAQNYGELTNALLDDARITPDTMRAVPYDIADDKITNSFGGAVVVVPVTLGGSTNNNGFRVTYPKVPGAVCAKLVSGAGTGWDAVGVGTAGNVKAFGTGQLAVAALATACAGDSGNGIDVIFDSI